MIFQANRIQNAKGKTILISDKEDSKLKLVRNYNGHFIIIRGIICEDIMTINIYLHQVLILPIS
jgi:hypothetical protein